jgi:hypothetical protein
MYCTLEMRCRPGTVQLYIVCIHVRAWTYPMRPDTARSCATAVARHRSGTARDFSTAARYGQGVCDIGLVRPGTARDFSTAARYGQGVCDIGRVRPGTARHFSTAARYGQGVCDIGRVRSCTARDVSTSARYGQGLCDIGRVRPGTVIGIRPAAATRRSEKLAGCGCGSRFQIKCHALISRRLI